MAPTWARVLWFVLIGWSLGILWIIISLLLILTIILAPLGLYMISKTWDVATLKTSPTTVIEEGRMEAGNGSQSTTQPAVGKEFFNISPGEFTYVTFSVNDDAKLKYSTTVLNGPNINTIVTYEKNIPEFKSSASTGWVESASSVNIESASHESIISKGEYAIIFDNTGRFGDQRAVDIAEVATELEVVESS